MNAVVTFVVILSSFELMHCMNDDVFSEELFIKPLANGFINLHFQFTVVYSNATLSPSSGHHYNLFPKAVGQIIDTYDVRELHLSLTQGLWRHEKWGYPSRSSPPGAELWAWFKGSKRVDESWANLANSLSGLFCASLNFIDATNTVKPNLSFRPSGVVSGDGEVDDDLLRYATLPRENVCTENLTPWQKLLPCESKAGLSTLFNAIKLYNAHYHALTFDVEPVCRSYPECTSTALRLRQSMDVVFRPMSGSSRMQWTLRSLFDRTLKGPCPLATRSYIHVDISNNSVSDQYTLTPTPSSVTSTGLQKVASYDIANLTAGGSPLNIQLKWNTEVAYGKTKPPVLHAHRYIAGYGQEKGGITCMLYNNHPSQQLDVVYMESLPWYVRLYLHTMKIKTEEGFDVKPDILRFVPGRDRGRPYLLELMISLPPSSVVTFSIQFDRAFLKWTEHPPDANIGFYLGSAVISAMLPSADNMTVVEDRPPSLSSSESGDGMGYFIRIYTEPLLLQLPLPDFSMPYNVICLVCTVFAIAFGSIHNLTTRKLDYEKEKTESFLTRIKNRIPFLRTKTTASKKEETGVEKELQPGEEKDSSESLGARGDASSSGGKPETVRREKGD